MRGRVLPVESECQRSNVAFSDRWGSEEEMVRLEIAPQGRIRIRFQFESVRPPTHTADWRENDRLAS